VADAGIIGKPDPLRGNLIKAFIALKPEVVPSDTLKKEIMDFVKKYFSPRIAPAEIDFRPRIPRADDGTVVRRILKAGAGTARLGRRGTGMPDGHCCSGKQELFTLPSTSSGRTVEGTNVVSLANHKLSTNGLCEQHWD